MNREYHSIYCHALKRNLEILVYGNSGKPLLVFPSAQGRFYQYEDFGMITTIAPFIDSGKIQVFCVDGIDDDSWFANIHPADKARRANDYHHAIVNDIVPFIRSRAGNDAGIMAHGVSFGGFHTANFYLRHPDIFDVGIALSGNYAIKFAVGDFYNNDVYYNEPVAYAGNINDPWFLERLKEHVLIIACGQGAWEDWNGEAMALASALGAKNLPHVFDMWGHDVGHDWPWWKPMILHFLGKLDRAGVLIHGHRMNEGQARFFSQNFGKI